MFGKLSNAGSLLFAVAIITTLSGPTRAEPFDYDKEYLACLDDPAYSAGGAMVGDCLNEKAHRLDATIETHVTRASKRFCTDDARAAIVDSQSTWFSYRERYCTLVEKSPGNTPAWISAGACRLDLARKRLETLRYLEQDASMWCLNMALDSRASRFGSPMGESGTATDATISWKGVRTRKGAGLRITNDGGRTIRLDTAGCRYCENGQDCADGVFVLSRRASVPENAEPPAFTGPAVLNVCHRDEGGVRLDIVSPATPDPATPDPAPLDPAPLDPAPLDPATDGPPSQRTYRAERRLDWAIDRGRLRVVLDGDAENARYWPAAAPPYQ